MEAGIHQSAALVRASVPPVLLSTEAPWHDILVVEQHRLPAQEWHESIARPYLVGMALSAPGRLDWRTADRQQDRTCEPLAGRCLFTMNSSVRWHQTEDAEVVFAALDPVFVDRVAEPLAVLNTKRFKPVAFTDVGIESVSFALRTELFAGCPSGRLYGEGLATALAARLVWLRGRTLNGNHIGALPSARLRRVLDYIDANLASDTSISRLAELAGISPRQFGRLFSQSTGLTPHQYILRRRIAGAKDLLLNSQLSLTEISFILGFRSQPHFTVTFKAKVGVTPNVFRNTRSAISGQLG